VLGDGRCLLAAGGGAARVRDLQSGELRAATEDDLALACLLADGLPEVAALSGPPVVFADPLRSLAGCLARTHKHVIAAPRTVAEAGTALRMAAVVAGDIGELQRRPLVTLAPPMASAAAADVCLAAAEARVPCGVPLAVPAGAADPWQALVQAFANALAAVCAAQIAAPGAAVYVASPGEGWANDGAAGLLLVAGAAQLAEAFGLPLAAGAMVTGAADPGWQASAENVFAALAAALGGVALVGGAGLLRAAADHSPQQLVMDAEIHSNVAKVAAGIPVDDETIALDVIKDVGIGGNYLGARHTRRHMKDVWRPRLFDRTPHEAWVREGMPQSYELATALVYRMQEESPADPADPALAVELLSIAQTAGKE
jgi:trimethylamine--corrinoid protein Co-methyltransferase